MLKNVLLGGALLCALTIGAEARPGAVSCAPLFDAMHLCSNQASALAVRHRAVRAASGLHGNKNTKRNAFFSSSYSGRPAGCPARAWAALGHAAGGPQVGAIVVWPHHVGKIEAVDGSRILVLSGNDGRTVRERWRTTRGVIAYRMAS
jgi:hypothetical protein